jgi:glycosyltransferase involved in cell wall biosynthesis
MLKVSIVIPAYNEEKTILEILQKVSKQRVSGVEFETIVVDDGSKDGTVRLLKQHPELYSKLVEQNPNGGKGAAVQAGLRVATGDYILFQDADLEYDPKSYADILFPILEFKADIVMGSRFLASPYTRVAYFWNKVGNRLITLLFNILNNTTFSDIYTCYLIYRRDLVDPNELKTFGWEQQAEILSLAVQRSKIYYDVPIAYHGRTYEEGKKIRAIHILPVFGEILRLGFFKSKRQAVYKANSAQVTAATISTH